MFFLSETYSDPTYTDDDTQLNIGDFCLIRAVNPHNCKKGGICIYSKKHFAVIGN